VRISDFAVIRDLDPSS